MLDTFICTVLFKSATFGGRFNSCLGETFTVIDAPLPPIPPVELLVDGLLSLETTYERTCSDAVENVTDTAGTAGTMDADDTTVLGIVVIAVDIVVDVAMMS